MLSAIDQGVVEYAAELLLNELGDRPMSLSYAKLFLAQSAIAGRVPEGQLYWVVRAAFEQLEQRGLVKPVLTGGLRGGEAKGYARTGGQLGDEYPEQPERMFIGDDAAAQPQDTARRLAPVSTCASQKAKYVWLQLDACVQRKGGPKPPRIHSAADIDRFVHEAIPKVETLGQELIIAIMLDSASRPIGASVVHVGALTFSLVRQADVLRQVLLLPAVSFILIHNHPSGQAEPSADDQRLTAAMIDAGRTVGVKLVDHVIVTETPGSYYSFRESGGSGFIW